MTPNESTSLDAAIAVINGTDTIMVDLKDKSEAAAFSHLELQKL